MPWPAGGISTANLDGGSDSPGLARPALLAAVQAVNDMAAARGAVDGVASLDAGGKVPSGQIPDGIIPAGSMLPYGGATAPPGWLLCDGSAVSRTTYAALFAAISTAFGAGDGSTTFNLPDARGRVLVGKDNMGGTAASRMAVTLTGTTSAGSAVITDLSSTSGLAVGMVVISANIPAGRTIATIDSATQVTLNSGTNVMAGTGSIRFGVVDGATLGAAGGSHVHTLTTPQMPAHTHGQVGTASQVASAGAFSYAMNSGSASAGTTTSTGGGQAHANVQPSLVVNTIIKT